MLPPPSILTQCSPTIHRDPMFRPSPRVIPKRPCPKTAVRRPIREFAGIEWFWLYILVMRGCFGIRPFWEWPFWHVTHPRDPMFPPPSILTQCSPLTIHPDPKFPFFIPSSTHFLEKSRMKTTIQTKTATTPARSRSSQQEHARATCCSSRAPSTRRRTELDSARRADSANLCVQHRAALIVCK